MVIPTNKYQLPQFADFRNFLFHIWHELGLPDPTPKQYRMANVLQNVIKHSSLVNLEPDAAFLEEYPMLKKANGDCTKRMVLEAFRGIGKSWICATIAVWVAYWNPNINIMTVSAASTKAVAFTTFCLKLIRQIPELQHLEPQKALGDRIAQTGFDIRGCNPAQEPSIFSRGIFGQMTGSRSDITFCDDVETPKTSETQLLREKLAHYISEIGGAIGKPESGLVIYLGTPQCEDSIYERLVNERGYKRIIIPARYPSDKWLSRYGDQLEPTIHADLTPEKQTGRGLRGNLGWPTDTRFNEAILCDSEKEFAHSGFVRQFMLDTSLEDAERFPLKLRDFIVMSIGDKIPATPQWTTIDDFCLKDLPCMGFMGDRFYAPINLKDAKMEWLSPTQTAMYIDPAGKGGDELAYAIGKFCNGLIWIVACRGFRDGYEEKNLIQIAELAKKYQVKEIITEPNFGAGMFDQLLSPILAKIYPCTVTPSEWTKGQKEKRIIDTLEPVLNQHLIVIDPRVIEQDILAHPEDSEVLSQQRSLMYQLSHITQEKGCLAKDDRVDALAGLVNYFMQNLGMDQARAKLDRRAEYMKKMVEDCSWTGIRQRNPDKNTQLSWISFGKK